MKQIPFRKTRFSQLITFNFEHTKMANDSHGFWVQTLNDEAL